MHPLGARNKVHKWMQEPISLTGALLLCIITCRTDAQVPPEMRESLLSIFTRERHQGEKMEHQLGKIMHTQRNLFGPVDHEQLHRDFQHMLHSNIEVAQQKWNFNFLQGVPLEGFLEWEELEGHEVPAFYHGCVVRESRRPLRHLSQPLCREEKAHWLTLAALVEKPKASKQTGAGKFQKGKKEDRRL